MLKLTFLVSLPGVASKEQIFLIAVVETVAKTLQDGKGILPFFMFLTVKGLADKSAVKFKLMCQIFQFLTKTMPPNQRPSTMNWVEMGWALHSESHGIIVEQLLSTIEVTWPNVRTYGTFPFVAR